MIYSIDNGQRIQGNVLIYDLYNGILQNIDNYDVFNIVQYIIPVGSDGFAYFYYEAETQDWILKYKDLDEENPIEIFRHSNNNDMITSPVSLTCEGNNIILALQYVKNEVYYTQLIELYSQGEILETENLELSPMFGDKYEITDFKIQDDIYYIKTFADNSEKYFLFKKADNNLSIIFPAICNLNYIMENIEESKTDVLFKQDEPVLGAFINVNIKNNAIISYNIDNVFLYDNNLELNFSECSDTDNILLVYQTDAGSYKYQLINDYKSIKTKVNNYALFEFPKDKSDLVKGDVRWKYIFS